MPRIKCSDDELIGGQVGVIYRGNLPVDDPKAPVEVLKIADVDLFHIGQIGEKVAAETVACAICEGVEFNVGLSSYYVAVRCAKCHWEACVYRE